MGDPFAIGEATRTDANFFWYSVLRSSFFAAVIAARSLRWFFAVFIRQQIRSALIGERSQAHRTEAAVALSIPSGGRRRFVGGGLLERRQRCQFAGVAFDFALDQLPILLHDRAEILPVETVCDPVEFPVKFPCRLFSSFRFFEDGDLINPKYNSSTTPQNSAKRRP